MTATSKIIITLWMAAAFIHLSPLVAGGPVSTGLILSSALGQAEAEQDPRRKSDELVKRSRALLRGGRLQEAKKLAQDAKSLKVKYNTLVQRLGDTPDKVLRDIERAEKGKSGGLTIPFLGQSKKDSPASQSSALNSFSNGAGAKVSKIDALKILGQARNALATGDMAAAVGHYEQVAAMPVQYLPGEYSPNDLAADLRNAGVDLPKPQPAPTGLQGDSAVGFGGQGAPVTAGGPGIVKNPFAGQAGSPPSQASGQQLAPIVGPDGRPVPGPAGAAGDPKTEALRLLSMSQAALDRGELNRAEQLARQADSLNVPDTSYAPNEPQPWVMLMHINRQRKLRGEVVQTGAVATISDIPQLDGPAIGPLSPLESSTADTPGGQALASPSNRLAQLVPAPDIAVPDGENANDLFRRGEDALKVQDLDSARQFFVRAWAHQDQLDPNTRQRLQDHLEIMTIPGTAGDGFEDAPQSALDQAEQERLKVLENQVAREQAEVFRQRSTDPRGAWQRLTELRERIAEADVNSDARGRLIARIDRNIQDMEHFIEHNRARIEQDERNRAVIAEVERYRRQRLQTQQQIADLVEEFNTLMDQQRFPEAVIVAKKAREIAPREPVVENLVWKGQYARQLASSLARQSAYQEGALASFSSIADSSVPFDDRAAIEFPEVRYWSELTDRRRRLLEGNQSSRYNAAEREIYRTLMTPVDVKFENQSLSYVVETLQDMAGINIVLDLEGMKSQGVSPETAISLPLRKPVSLKSALNLILEPLHLGYVIQDEVLRITSERERSGDVYQETYYVADLVTPIPNFVPSSNMGLAGALLEAHRTQGAGLLGGMHSAPLTVAMDPAEGAVNPDVYAQAGASGFGPVAGPSQGPLPFGPGGLGGGPQADFDSLIELITTTIEPDSWDEVGGEGAIQEFEPNLSLVVSQTQDVHEKIVDLLAQLRRIQDLQVTIEVRFITLSDDFFERIGVDFDFELDDNSGLSVSQVNTLDDSGPSVTVGLDETGNFRSDLDLRFEQGSFGATIPTFGGYDAGSAANFGFAILSDIEAFFVIQAAQGDIRTNVMQAPKVTLYNGQTASVNDNTQRPFVTSVIPVVGDFAAAHQPVVTVLSEGTSLSVSAVVSPDRRFVRLTLVPFFSRIGEVEQFTFNGTTTSNTGTAAVDPTDPTQSVSNEASNVTEGTTVQLPSFAFTSVSTTVSVPDGGTILLGGIKRLAEERRENGMPLMSKLPYVNRLFRNVGIGRETESLMMMVTPRIIIQEEEEEKLGVNIQQP